MALFDVGADLLRGEERPSAESGLPFVIDERPSGGAGEAAVGEHFADRSDAKPIVAVAGFAAELLQLLGAGFGVSGFGRVRDLNGGAWQLGAVCPVEKLPFGVGTGDIGFHRSAGLDQAGDPKLKLVAHILEQALAHILRLVGGDQPRIKVGPLANHAVGLTARVLFDDPSLRIGRGAVDVGQLQSLTVADGAMAAGAREHDWVIGRGGVQIGADGLPLFGEMVLIPVAAGDPLAWAEFPRLLGDLLFHLRQRVGPAKIDIPPGVASQMDVCVEEPREHGAPA